MFYVINQVIIEQLLPHPQTDELVFYKKIVHISCFHSQYCLHGDFCFLYRPGETLVIFSWMVGKLCQHLGLEGSHPKLTKSDELVEGSTNNRCGMFLTSNSVFLKI